MTRSSLALFLAAVSCASTGAARRGTGLQQAASPGTRHIYISAIDKKGGPVTGLTTKEVTIREDGDSRDVVGVQPATAPLTIALLVDDTGPGIRFLREGVGAFRCRGLQPPGRLGPAEEDPGRDDASRNQGPHPDRAPEGPRTK